MSVVLALSAFAAACGGGSDDSAPPTSPSTGGPNPPASANSAPTIQGQPGSSVRVGQTYTFQPTVNDSNGDTLTFSATNLPPWLSLNTSNGRLSGTPAASDVATVSGIAITVSDGRDSATLGPFSIAVTQTASGSALLSWMPPSQNTDGSSLVNLAGYRVLYGTSASNLSQTVTLTNPSLSSYLVENLSAGTWYFSVVALNAQGGASAPSSVALKTIT